MKKIPDLGFWKLWNISFGFFGVQIAYALQSANISRIFSTLGADPHDLSYFWILPPLAGIIVQPHRCFERPHLDTFRTTYSLPVCGGTRCGVCHVPVAECGKLRNECQCRHDFWPGIFDVSRYFHQYGYATF